MAVAVILPVGGCARTGPFVAPAHLASKRCAKVAEDRTMDGRVNGYDEQLQQAVFRDTYADCVKWEARGFRPVSP
jgi:hypothetical protein